MKKAVISLLLVFVLLFTASAPVAALAGTANAPAVSAAGDKSACDFVAFFRDLFARIQRFWDQMIQWFRMKKEGVK